MSRGPRGEYLVCPECERSTIAIIPPAACVVENEDTADGKVKVNCWECGVQFPVYFRKD